MELRRQGASVGGEGLAAGGSRVERSLAPSVPVTALRVHWARATSSPIPSVRKAAILVRSSCSSPRDLTSARPRGLFNLLHVGPQVAPRSVLAHFGAFSTDSDARNLGFERGYEGFGSAAPGHGVEAVGDSLWRQRTACVRLRWLPARQRRAS